MKTARNAFAFFSAIALVAGLSCFLWPGSARAQLSDVFEVAGIPVDVTAGTAAQARERAIIDGERQALRILVERLALRQQWDYVPDLSKDEVQNLIRDFSVSDEKTSAVRYLADLTVRFREDAVRQLLIDNGIQFAETPSKPVLVLPVYPAVGATVLWDEPNPWRQAWGKRDARRGLVPFVLPLGDLQDVGAIGAEQAVAGDEAQLAAIAARYETGDVLVAEATLRVEPSRGGQELEVVVNRFGSALQMQTVLKTFQSRPGETDGQLLARAVEEVVLEVEDNWKEDNLLQIGNSGVLAVTVPVGGLPDWLVVRRKLAGVAVIQRVDPVLISRSEVRVNLHYLGNQDQLALALEQADLGLQGNGDEWWLGKLGAALPIPQTPIRQ